MNFYRINKAFCRDNNIKISEVIFMAKQGMRRPDPKDPHGTESNRKTHIKKNGAPPVPEIQGRAKSSKEKANSKRQG